MNAPTVSSTFSAVEMAPRDPILGLNEAFQADPRPDKVNLGVGVYTDDEGRLPLLASVRAAEKARLDAAPPRGYQPIEGPAPFRQAVQRLAFAEVSDRIVTVQAVGGTGALKVGADFLRRLNPGAGVFISDPSWENHRALFEAAGFKTESYPYYAPSRRGLDFPAMRAGLSSLSPGSVVVLHACCHNPTGSDLGGGEWEETARICRERGLVPFLDMAYQGFGEGIEADASAARLFAASGQPFLLSSSFSKSFSLYGERVGALSIGAASKEEAGRVLSQVKRLIRTNYSSPPAHGAALVCGVLQSPELRRTWEGELSGMRERIRSMREALADRLGDHGLDFSFIAAQRGMFSYTGLTPGQVERLRGEFGIYAVSTGRICLAALNSKNADRVSAAIAAVVKG
jgi:aromatic-amino-acid transaminase